MKTFLNASHLRCQTAVLADPLPSNFHSASGFPVAMVHVAATSSAGVVA
jgi:hypothetical protein